MPKKLPFSRPSRCPLLRTGGPPGSRPRPPPGSPRRRRRGRLSPRAARSPAPAAPLARSAPGHERSSQHTHTQKVPQQSRAGREGLTWLSCVRIWFVSVSTCWRYSSNAGERGVESALAGLLPRLCDIENRLGVEAGDGRVAPSPDFSACASIGGVSPLRHSASRPISMLSAVAALTQSVCVRTLMTCGPRSRSVPP